MGKATVKWWLLCFIGSVCWTTVVGWGVWSRVVGDDEIVDVDEDIDADTDEDVEVGITGEGVAGDDDMVDEDGSVVVVDEGSVLVKVVVFLTVLVVTVLELVIGPNVDAPGIDYLFISIYLYRITNSARLFFN